MLALIRVPHEYSRDPFFERSRKPCWIKLFLSIVTGMLGFVIVLRILLSLQSLCLPIQREGKFDQTSCSVSKIL